MTREEFKLHFEEAVRRAVSAYSRVSGESIAHLDRFEVHAPNYVGQIVYEDEAIEAIFLDKTLFYKVVDVGVISQEGMLPIGFIRVSGHDPGPFEDTLKPQDLGPFNILEPLPRNLLPDHNG